MSQTAPTTTAPDPTPASTTDLQSKTQTAFVTLSLVTQACHGILNTVFVPPSPKPAWFDDLQAKLDAAKAVATDWIDNIAPGVTGGVPLQVIDYGTTYSAITQEIQSIADTYPDAMGKDDPHVKQVNELIAALVSAIDEIISKAQTMSDTLRDWGDRIQKAHDDLTSGAANIQSAEAALATDVQKMNTAIATLQEMIHKENIAIVASAGAIDAGLALTVVGIALAPETGGPPLVVAAVGALLVVGGAVTWGVMQHKINEQFSEIAADQAELASDQRQIVALKGLATASNQSIQYTTDAGNSLSDFRTSWTVFQGELQGVVSKLEAGENSLSMIVATALTNAAAQEWQDATSFAQGLADAPVEVAATTLPMDSTQQQAA